METSLRTLVAGFAVTVLGACAMYEKTGPGAVVGTWTNSLGTVWALSSDGTFTVDLTHHGKVDVSGKYAVSGDTLKITDVHGKTPKACKGQATYKFTRPDKDSLQFTLVNDKCKLRIQNITAG